MNIGNGDAGEFCINTIDKFYGSAALKCSSNVEKNINVIRENLRYFKLSPQVQFFPFDIFEKLNLKMKIFPQCL